MSRLLIVTAIAAERDAIASSTSADVIVGGVGAAEAAATTARALVSGRYDVVLSAGIAGGFAPIALTTVVVATAIVVADLGAETPDGFVPVDELGFGRTRYEVDPDLAWTLAQPGARQAEILTVSTVTGTSETAARLALRHPDAAAEAMEGAGIAAAATAAGVRFGELRAISNLVGPRDRAAWRVPEALAALASALTAIRVE